MRIVGRVVLTAGILLLFVAAAVALWPLHATGVTGNAFMPHYHAFGFFSTDQLPSLSSIAQQPVANVTIPQDVVHNRRHVAELLALIAAVFAAAGGYVTSRPVGRGRHRNADAS